jgi:hypothetical protein
MQCKEETNNIVLYTIQTQFQSSASSYLYAAQPVYLEKNKESGLSHLSLSEFLLHLGCQ